MGNNISISSVDTILDVLLWDSKGRLFAAYDGPCNDSQTRNISSIVEVDPETLMITAAWTPPNPNTTLNLAYIELLTETDEIVVSSLQGQIYIIKRTLQNNEPMLNLSRTIDLASTGVLQGIQLLNSIFDASGNMWFTTGLVRGVLGTTPQKATIAGYVTPNGSIYSTSIPNQMPENGLTINGDTAFLITGPTYADDHNNSVGFLMALKPGSTSDGSATGLSVLWNATYDAGSSLKPGNFARGSGSTPTLLGDDFVAVTDNGDQMHLLIYPQNASGIDVSPICKVPLFQEGKGANDNGPIAHFDGSDWHVAVQNMYDQPGYTPPTVPNVDGPYNNLSSMVPGISKVIVNGDGSGCYVNWTAEVSMTTLPILSTATGLLYGHIQNKSLAVAGDYVWYVTALDWETGNTVWSAQAGSGGRFNDGYKNIVLGNGGTMYQIVRGGVVMAKDGI